MELRDMLRDMKRDLEDIAQENADNVLHVYKETGMREGFTRTMLASCYVQDHNIFVLGLNASLSSKLESIYDFFDYVDKDDSEELS